MALKAKRDLDAMRAWAFVRISEDAEALRQQYITPGYGKSMVYREKAKEAREVEDHIAPQTLDAADFPMLASEIAVSGGNLESAAATFATKAAAWRNIAGVIETLEGAAKRDLAASASPTEIETLADSVTQIALTAALAAET